MENGAADDVTMVAFLLMPGSVIPQVISTKDSGTRVSLNFSFHLSEDVYKRQQPPPTQRQGYDEPKYQLSHEYVASLPDADVGINAVSYTHILQGESEDGVIIQFDPATRANDVTFNGDKAYPTVYSTADLTLESLTITGPTNEHHGIDGV